MKTKRINVNLKKVAKWALISLASMIILFAMTVMVFLIHARIAYQGFYDTAFRQFRVPGISSGFVPQGLVYYEIKDIFLISGYTNKNNYAMLFIVEPDGGYRKISIVGNDGKSFVNHAGGISIWGGFIFLAGCDGKCYVLDQESVIDSDNDSARVIGSFDAYNNADFCYTYNDQLYIGEYYHSLKYRTDPSHHLTTPAGEKNNALITVFDLATGGQFGVDAIPAKVYSITGTVQGMCVTDDGEFALSTSVFFLSSRLYFYNYDAVHYIQDNTFFINEKPVPLYFMDNETLTRTMVVPPKAEGIDCYGNTVYIVFESASNRFVLGKFIGGDYVYRFEIPNQ